jgi:mRNA interferase HigB
MRLIACSNLVAFWEAALKPGHLWSIDNGRFNASWQNTGEVQASFSKAKVLNAERVRFEVAGGNYRLIVAFKFEAQIAFVKFMARTSSTMLIDALTISVLRRYDMDIFPIRSDADHLKAVQEIERLGCQEGELRSSTASIYLRPWSMPTKLVKAGSWRI